MTKQPKWKCIVNLGDMNPLDYGGLFVCIDETGVYPPEMEKLSLVTEGDSTDQYQTHRVILEPCTYINGILSDNPYHPDKPVWFATNIKAIASCFGISKGELLKGLCSKDPMMQACAWAKVYDYHGWENGDTEPNTINRKTASAILETDWAVSK